MSDKLTETCERCKNFVYVDPSIKIELTQNEKRLITDIENSMMMRFSDILEYGMALITEKEIGKGLEVTKKAKKIFTSHEEEYTLASIQGAATLLWWITMDLAKLASGWSILPTPDEYSHMLERNEKKMEAMGMHKFECKKHGITWSSEENTVCMLCASADGVKNNNLDEKIKTFEKEQEENQNK
jgi:hypothetical protein